MKSQLLTTVAIIGLGLAGAGVGHAQSGANMPNGQPAWSSSGSHASAYREPQAMSRQQIKKLQERLTAGGYYDGAIDGMVGPRTRHAIAEFQRKNGLAETGRFDPQTANLLEQKKTVGEGSGQPTYSTKPKYPTGPSYHMQKSTAGEGSSESSPYSTKPKYPNGPSYHLQNGTAGQGSSESSPYSTKPQYPTGPSYHESK